MSLRKMNYYWNESESDDDEPTAKVNAIITIPPPAVVNRKRRRGSSNSSDGDSPVSKATTSHNNNNNENLLWNDIEDGDDLSSVDTVELMKRIQNHTKSAADESSPTTPSKPLDDDKDPQATSRVHDLNSCTDDNAAAVATAKAREDHGDLSDTRAEDGLQSTLNDDDDDDADDGDSSVDTAELMNRIHSHSNNVTNNAPKTTGSTTQDANDDEFVLPDAPSSDDESSAEQQQPMVSLLTQQRRMDPRDSNNTASINPYAHRRQRSPPPSTVQIPVTNNHASEGNTVAFINLYASAPQYQSENRPNNNDRNATTTNKDTSLKGSPALHDWEDADLEEAALFDGLTTHRTQSWSSTHAWRGPNEPHADMEDEDSVQALGTVVVREGVRSLDRRRSLVFSQSQPAKMDEAIDSYSDEEGTAFGFAPRRSLSSTHSKRTVRATSDPPATHECRGSHSSEPTSTTTAFNPINLSNNNLFEATRSIRPQGWSHPQRTRPSKLRDAAMSNTANVAAVIMLDNPPSSTRSVLPSHHNSIDDDGTLPTFWGGPYQGANPHASTTTTGSDSAYNRNDLMVGAGAGDYQFVNNLEDEDEEAPYQQQQKGTTRRRAASAGRGRGKRNSKRSWNKKKGRGGGGSRGGRGRGGRTTGGTTGASSAWGNPSAWGGASRGAHGGREDPNLKHVGGAEMSF